MNGPTESVPGTALDLQPRSWKGYTALILVWQVAASGCFYAVYAVTPFVRAQFGVSTTRIGFLLTALMLGYTVCVAPVGRLIDRYGEARVLVVGLTGLGATTVLVTAASTYPLLLGAVAVLGAFYATAIPGTNKAVFNAIPAERLNVSMGIKQMGVTAGSGLSSLLVPLSASRVGWEVAFLGAGAVAAVVTVAFRVCYDAGTGDADESGTSLRTHVEDPEYVLLVAAGFFLGAGLFTTVGYTLLYVTDVVGASSVFAGATLAAAQASGSVGRIGFGWIADNWFGSLTRSTLVLLAIQAGVSAILFAAIPFVEPPLVVLGLFALLGAFILGFTGVYYSCIGSIVPNDGIGSATAGGQLALNSGALVAPPAFGYLVDARGYDDAWTLLACTTVVAFVLFLVLIGRRNVGRRR
ncbi:MFS transporter [Haloterrigena salifodinae]|uniref:MFS transporter n=1 Tax=Haloterrigena salifodinae TaxID=2675099 RepID=A0A8T8E5W0_9EURY|nr:MFS transporter [Haloterrigena salifodinae]QRV17254.1 MFS transporter [Haloterrigena salifodinae]